MMIGGTFKCLKIRYALQITLTWLHAILRLNHCTQADNPSWSSEGAAPAKCTSYWSGHVAYEVAQYGLLNIHNVSSQGISFFSAAWFGAYANLGPLDKLQIVRYLGIWGHDLSLKLKGRQLLVYLHDGIKYATYHW